MGFGPGLAIGSLLFVLILLCVLGNLLVIVAILSERDLRSRPQYYLIFSLAVADLMVGLLITPLGAWTTLRQKWELGVTLCDFWISVDVLVCTSSILHLVAIALDRYWSVTNIYYTQNRTPRRIFTMLLAIWVLSLLISLAPQFELLHLKDKGFVSRVRDQKICLISQDIAYQVFSTSTAFYIPLCAIIIVYYKIMRAAKKRFRRERDRKTLNRGVMAADPAETVLPPKASKLLTSLQLDSSPSAAPKNSFYVHLLRSQNNYMVAATATDSPVHQSLLEEEEEDQDAIPQQELKQEEKEQLLQQNGGPQHFATRMPAAQQGVPPPPPAPFSRLENVSEEEKEDKNRLQTANGEDNNNKNKREGGRAAPGIAETEFHVAGAATAATVKNGGALVGAKVSNTMVTTAVVVAAATVSSSPSSINAAAAIASGGTTSRQLVAFPRHLKAVGSRAKRKRGVKKESLETRRERKAWRTLAIITGTFFCCWTPFFVLSLYRPICINITGESECRSIPPLMEQIFNWLGYLNSALNPLIYTIFSLDFRMAFERILKRMLWFSAKR